MLFLAPRALDLVRIAATLLPLLYTLRSVADKDGEESKIDLNLKVDLNMRF